MSVEFVDTNILIYAHDGGAGSKHRQAVALLTRLVGSDSGALSTQVLSEFYAVATRRMGMESLEAEQVVSDLKSWIVHRPGVDDLLRAAKLQRRYQISWWDALVLNSAMELGCGTMWSEDLAVKQKFGPLVIRNPFHE